LERSGRYADAATIYFRGPQRSDESPALLGLERSSSSEPHGPSCCARATGTRAPAREPALRSLELRVYAALNQTDSLAAIALRWAASVPRSDAPYREWGLALVDRRLWDEARRAYLTGRKTLGGEGSSPSELAEMEQRAATGKPPRPSGWRAVTRSADVGPNAASQLADAPAPVHEHVARILTGPMPPSACVA